MNSDLARIRMWDTVTALAAGAEPGQDLVVSTSEELDPELREQYGSLVRAGLAARGMLPSRVTLIDLHLPRSFGFHPDLGEEFVSGRTSRVFHGEAEGNPFCAVVLQTDPVEDLVRRVEDDEAPEYFRPTRYCRFHARFGLPGDEILLWLDRDAFVFVLADEGSEPPLDQFYQPPPVFFGVQVVRWGSDFRIERCVDGDREACLDAILDPFYFTDPASGRPEVPGFAGSVRYGSGFYGYGQAFMADLEGTFGEDAFRRFWTSDSPVPQAFENAFGVSMGEYVHQWAADRIPPSVLDPALSPVSTAVSLLFLLACAGGGTWTFLRVEPD